MFFSREALGGRTTTRIHLIEGVSNNDVLFLPAAILAACFLVLIKVNGRGHTTDKRWYCKLEDLANRLEIKQGMIRSSHVSRSRCHHSKLNVQKFSLEIIPNCSDLFSTF